MSFRDRAASAPMSPLLYWLTCILGMLLGFAILALLGITTLTAAWVKKG